MRAAAASQPDGQQLAKLGPGSSKSWMCSPVALCFSCGLVFLNFCKLLGKWKPSTPLMVSTFQAVHQLKRCSHYTYVIWWPNLQLMQLWCHLVAKFVTNASGVVWWPNLQLILVVPSGGQNCNKCNYGAIWWPSDHEVCFSTDHVCISSLVLGIFVF